MKSTWTEFRGPLAEEMKAFVTYKRALNRYYRTEELALRLLDTYLYTRGISSRESITSDVLQEFLASRPRSRPRSYNHLLGVVRRFFAWTVAHGTFPTAPSLSGPKRNNNPHRPFIFNSDQMRSLLTAASELPDASGAPRRGVMYRLIFSILYSLGLRVSEVTNLRRCDVDFDRRLLVIRETKFSKSRLVPFGPRLGARIREYMDIVQAADDFPLFWFERRPYRAVNPCTISLTFHQLVPKLNLPLAPGQAHPRLHDLRHSFAVGTLLRWYREGRNPADRLLHLSTFLGHSDPASTAVYLTITTDLLDEAGKRFEIFSTSLVGEAE